MPREADNTSSETHRPPPEPAQRKLERLWYHSRSCVLPLLVVFLLGAAWEGAVRFFEIPVYMLPALSVTWSEFLTNVSLVSGHTFAVVGATVGEFVAADKSLGYQIMAATAFFNTPAAFGALVILSLLGIVLFQAVAIIERVFFSWSTPMEADMR